MIEAKKQVALLFMMTVITNIIGVLIMLITGIVMINSRPRNSFVQLTDGRVIQVTNVQMYERTPQTIKKFIRDTFTLMFSWNGYFTDPVTKRPKLDLGVPLANNQKVPTVAMYGSFAFDEQIRNAVLQQIAPLVPNRFFEPATANQIGQKPRVIITIDYIGNPISIGKGIWSVELVSALIQFDMSTPQGRLLTEFNKKVRVRAIEPTTTIIYNPTPTEIAAKENSEQPMDNKNVNQVILQPYEGIEEIIRSIRESGLQIIGMEDLQ